MRNWRTIGKSLGVEIHVPNREQFELKSVDFEEKYGRLMSASRVDVQALGGDLNQTIPHSLWGACTHHVPDGTFESDRSLWFLTRRLNIRLCNQLVVR